MEKRLLLWNNCVGTWIIREGDKTKLSEEEKEEGYVDYFLVYPEDGYGHTTPREESVGRYLLKQYVSDFKSNKEIVEYVRNVCILPDADFEMYEYKGGV